MNSQIRHDTQETRYYILFYIYEVMKRGDVFSEIASVTQCYLHLSRNIVGCLRVRQHAFERWIHRYLANIYKGI